MKSILFALLLSALAPSAWAQVRVDANILSGVDVSGSMNALEIQIQLDGIAQAMQSPVVQAAIKQGRHHQIGFAVYMWADSVCPVVVDWRIIASAEDAAAMASDLAEKAQQARAKFSLYPITDISGAMLCGGKMLAEAPFKADRSVLNIITNGLDNRGSLAELIQARDVMREAKITVNAVAMPGGDDHNRLIPYLQQNVVTGPISFVLQVSKAEELTIAWRRKFVGDIAMVKP
jgi:Ca-activated chloride channel family protein